MDGPQQTTGTTDESSEHQATGSGDAPVTLSVTRRVKPGREREFEDFLRGITAAASTFPGYVGS